MKKLYRFSWDCGRAGEVEGVFIADAETVTKAIGSSVYFGEILGKHSEVYGTLEEKDLKVLSDDQEFITKCEVVFNAAKSDQWSVAGTISGYNPFDYMQNHCDDCGEEIEEDEEHECDED